MVLILSFHLICDKVVKLVYNTKYFHRICATIIYFPEETINMVAAVTSPHKNLIFVRHAYVVLTSSYIYKKENES